MRKFIFVLGLILVAKMALLGQQLNTPLTITGNVYNSSGEVIADNALRFRIYPEGSPQFLLTRDSPSCGYTAPVLYAELGNLAVSWNYGDILIVILEDIEEKERVTFSWPIDSTAKLPDLRTQEIPVSEQISGFTLSDRGIFFGEPLSFSFNSVLSDLAGTELKILSYEGKVVANMNNPAYLGNDRFQFQWNGKSATGDNLRSGLYYYFFSVTGKVLHSGIITLKNE
jgi:hypothetical protein